MMDLQQVQQRDFQLMRGEDLLTSTTTFKVFITLQVIPCSVRPLRRWGAVFSSTVAFCYQFKFSRFFFLAICRCAWFLQYFGCALTFVIFQA